MNETKARWYRRLWNFLKDVWAELKRVTWPSKNEVINTTIVVIAATIFFGFFLFFMDVIFAWLLNQVKNLFG
ncbi:MAG TPA: preprotein translocase subunit SecE [Candidatus Aminicenantes bacterium]|nr:preprotein translocase subunit SecE [Candidatus Aminicenantes bacterium]HRY65515.1 preprotein translocase subunit SecE [Candidatus Aminicenantes bacterium]HRZ73284.1 preprotein translocase subunit SecE [Candidatus Aminicenantes bacterium]